MLCLSRKCGESLVIIHDGEELAITVNEIRGETVELGCAGPRSFVVLRAELTQKEEGTA